MIKLGIFIHQLDCLLFARINSNYKTHLRLIVCTYTCDIRCFIHS